METVREWEEHGVTYGIGKKYRSMKKQLIRRTSDITNVFNSSSFHFENFTCLQANANLYLHWFMMLLFMFYNWRNISYMYRVYIVPTHERDRCSFQIIVHHILPTMFHLFLSMLYLMHKILRTSLTWGHLAWEIKTVSNWCTFCVSVVVYRYSVFFVYCSLALYTLVFGFQLYIFFDPFPLASNIHIYTTFGQYAIQAYGCSNNNTTTYRPIRYQPGLHWSRGIHTLCVFVCGCCR